MSRAGIPAEPELISLPDRDWLYRFCYRLAGNADAADDIAQETLLEAWRHRDRLSDPEALRPWLTGIARNVHLRWLRKQGRDNRRLFTDATAGRPGEMAADDLLSQLPDDSEPFEVELERGELATLLDRALGLLPAPTRELLIKHYIEESSQAEIADQLSLSQGALAVRLHRGRLSLRRVLVDQLGDELLASGIAIPDDAYWQPTTIWCRYCGRHRLVGRIKPDGEFLLRCPHCCRTPEEAHSQWCFSPSEPLPAKSFEALYRWGLKETHREIQQVMAGDPGTCPACGTPIRVTFGVIDDCSPLVGGRWGMRRFCPNSACTFGNPDGVGAGDRTTLGTMALGMPEGMSFWRKHPQLLTLPEREIEHDGVPAVVIGFQDMASDARLDVISHRDTLRTLDIYHLHDTGSDG